MSKRYDRRDVLKAVAAAGASFLLPSPKPSLLGQSSAPATPSEVEIQVGIVATGYYLIYSAVHECATNGVPIVRALWLHYPDDPVAVSRSDEYLWGRNPLVAPVVEPGATARKIYLPHGAWFDFWTSERVEGGQEISRKVDLETMPLYVRAGSILPLGPVKQHAEEIRRARLSSMAIPVDVSF